MGFRFLIPLLGLVLSPIASLFSSPAASALDGYCGTVEYKALIAQLPIKRLKAIDLAAAPLLHFRPMMVPMSPTLEPGSLMLAEERPDQPPRIYKADRAGGFNIPLDAKMLAKNPRFWISTGCKTGYHPSTEMVVPLSFVGTESTQPVAKAIASYDRLVRHAGMLARMFVPKVKTVVIRLDSARPDGMCHLTVGGTERALPAADDRGEIRARVKAFRFTGGETLTCAEPVQEILLETVPPSGK